MKLNEQKLTAMIEAVMKTLYPIVGEPETSVTQVIRNMNEHKLRNALTPYAMEITDEEIITVANSRSKVELWQLGFITGAKFIRDGNK